MSMSARPTLIPPPSEEDVLRALAKDPAAGVRARQQNSRRQKRLREIDAWDADEEAR